MLIVEDEPATAALESSLLESRGIRSVICPTGTEAVRRFGEMRVDAVLLDLGLPDLDGLDLIDSIRQRSAVPIMVVTMRSSADALARCLARGADDFVSKPFAPVELTSRLERLIRRTRSIGLPALPGQSEGADGAEFPAFDAALLLGSGEVVGPTGVKCRLTGREQVLASMIFNRPGEVTPRSEIARLGNGGPVVMSNRTIDLHVSRLRQKLRAVGFSDTMIETVRGAGYRFRPQRG